MPISSTTTCREPSATWTTGYAPNPADQLETDHRRRHVLTKLAHQIVRHRWLVIGVWVALTVFGGFAAQQVSSRWFQSTSVPGQPAYEASQRSLHALGVGDRSPTVVVFHTDADA